MLYFMENPIKMRWFGGFPIFLETPLFAAKATQGPLVTARPLDAQAATSNDTWIGQKLQKWFHLGGSRGDGISYP